MLTPKHYQLEALGSLSAFLRGCQQMGGPAAAFAAVTHRRHGVGVPYVSAPGFDGKLAEVPYVCLRLPTGGGKTLLACLSLSVIHRELLQREHSVVLWLVPSRAIQNQTLAALRDRSHPYRQAIETEVGAVAVLDPTEALYVQRPVLDGHTTIIVSTLQAFRVGDQNGRKVYESNGALDHHFADLDALALALLENREDGTVPRSLANVLRLRRPVIVVDEAHNARTSLSFEVLAKFRPSCILEFTATPAREEAPSNILHHTSARELHAEDMIKLPIRLETRTDWKRLLADAVALREDLHKRANAEEAKTGERLRPIVLIKCDRRDKRHETLSVDVVEQALLEDCKVPSEQVVRATGEDRGLEGVDLKARDCRINFILTVDALREGWDCSFAYVLCTVAELRAAGAVEQLLGRVLRLPEARRKHDEHLNRAYAFANSNDFIAAAEALRDSLVDNGFNRLEAADLVVHPVGQQGEIELPATRRTIAPRVVRVRELPDTTSWSPDLRQRVEVNTDRKEIVLRDLLTTQEIAAVAAGFVMDANRAEFVAAAEQLARQGDAIVTTPAERGEKLAVPLFSLNRQGELRMFDDNVLADRPWSLREYMHQAADFAFSVNEDQASYGEIDVSDQGRVQWRFADQLREEFLLLRQEENWTEAGLVDWLDRNIPHIDIPAEDALVFFSHLLGQQLTRHGLKLGTLVRHRFLLRDFMENGLNWCRKQARTVAYQDILFDQKEGRVEVLPENVFQFSPDKYPARRICAHSADFQKHYHRQVGDLGDTGEEFECARFLDGLPGVRVWIRNLDRQPQLSFWLPTATDRFYPDFVCELTDGRLLVVEYKGEHLWSGDDAKEKRRLGELWMLRSNGRCLFVMPNGRDFDTIRAVISS